jgi:hypothetical protein
MRIALAAAVAALLASLGVSAASAQAPYPNSGYSPISSQTSSQVQTTSYERNTGRNNPALNFFGAPQNVAFGTHQRTVQPPAPVAVQTKPMGKPFSTYRAQSTISPYLRLDYLETDTALPNYYMFVRPALDQNNVNSQQANDSRALRAGVRQANAQGAVVRPAGGIPTTGHSSQFMNGGGYYPGVAR